MCGCEYTSKLERMFQDMGVSTTLTDQYRVFQENQGVKETGIVYSKNNWKEKLAFLFFNSCFFCDGSHFKLMVIFLSPKYCFANRSKTFMRSYSLR